MSLGIDVVDVARFSAVVTRTPGIEKRLFTEAERAYCASKADPLRHLAGTLAAKEAVMKALGLTPMITWARRIEIARDGSGAPHARVPRRNSPVALSITHDGSVAAAVALVDGTGVEHVDDLGPWLDRFGVTDQTAVGSTPV